MLGFIYFFIFLNFSKNLPVFLQNAESFQSTCFVHIGASMRYINI
jgi:hypothetical protein